MKLVSVNELVPGYVVAENIYSVNDRLLLEKGAVLDEQSILRIKAHSLYNIFVEDQKKEVEQKAAKPAAELSFAEKFKSTEEFILFKEHIEEKAEKLEETFKLLINDAFPLDVETITEPVYDLFVEAGGTAGIFDMLHNLRDYNDSVYMHSLNVALICNTLATWMRLSPEEIKLATAGGLLHDIGKVMIPEEILNKKEKLDNHERLILKEHVVKGYELVKDKNLDPHIKNCILMHHEMHDGSGYPLGLKGNKIDSMASIVTVANIYDEYTSSRPNRKAVCPFSVIEQFEYEGIQKFDVNVIMTFLSNIVNTFIANRVLLSTGQTGDIIFINPDHLSKPVVKCGDDFVDLAAKKGISILAVV